MRPPRPACLCNRLLLQLGRGPVLASEIVGAECPAAMVRNINKYILAGTGRKIVSRRIRRPSKWGLGVMDRVYRLV